MHICSGVYLACICAIMYRFMCTCWIVQEYMQLVMCVRACVCVPVASETAITHLHAHAHQEWHVHIEACMQW